MACKRRGRQVQQFDKDVWDARCGEIVVAGNIAKFSQDPELKAFLLSTGDAILAEGGLGTRSGASAWERATPWPGTQPCGEEETC